MGTFNVRIFAYAGTRQVPMLLPSQPQAAALEVNDEPCLWSQVLTVTSGSVTPVNSTVQTDASRILVVEVQDGQTIRYEVQPNGPSAVGAKVAGNASRRLNGTAVLAWNSGYALSIVDATPFP